jgi:hypothetical protein
MQNNQGDLNSSSNDDSDIRQDLLMELRKEVSGLQQILYITAGVGLASVAFLGYVQIFEVPKAIRNGINERIESSVPVQVDSVLPEAIAKYIDDTEGIITNLERIEQQTLTSERVAKERVAEIEAILISLRSTQESMENYTNCQWVSVGYDKSHENLGAWCPAGYFVTQLDLAGGERSPENWPVIEQAQCCTP